MPHFFIVNPAIFDTGGGGTGTPIGLLLSLTYVP
jgi:hypothetical protein